MQKRRFEVRFEAVMELKIRSTTKRLSCSLSSTGQPYTERKHNRTKEDLLHANSWFK